MVKRLTVSQIAFLRSEPLSGPNKIKFALRLLETNQRSFAEALGMHHVTFNRIVAGRDIRLSTARRIADAFGAGIDDIFPPAPNTQDQRTGKDRRRATKARKANRRSGTDRREKAQVAA